MNLDEHTMPYAEALKIFCVAYLQREGIHGPNGPENCRIHPEPGTCPTNRLHRESD